MSRTRRAPGELIQVNYNNANGTWTVVRGAENTGRDIPFGELHRQAGGLGRLAGYGSFYQLANLGTTSYTTVQNTATATPIASIYVPSNGTQPGGVAAGVWYEMNAIGTHDHVFRGERQRYAVRVLGYRHRDRAGIHHPARQLHRAPRHRRAPGGHRLESRFPELNPGGRVDPGALANANATLGQTTAAYASSAPVTINGTSGAAQQLCLAWKWSTATNNTISVVSSAYQIQ